MPAVDHIEMEARHLDVVRSVFGRHLPYKRVWAYGSRVKGDAGGHSDLDCVAFDATSKQVMATRDAFEEGDLPFTVQVMRWDTIPEHFKPEIERQYYVLRTEEDWGEFRLGEVAEVIHGVSYRSTDLEPSKTAMVTLKSFARSGGFSVNGFKEFTGQYKPDQEVARGDLVVAHTDLTQGAEIVGNPALVIDVPQYENLVISMDVGKVNIKMHDVLDHKFLYYLMKTPQFKHHCVANSSGTTVLHMSRSAISDYVASLPPLHQQETIAEILSSLDDKIDLLHRQNRTLEELAQTLFRKWFVEDADPDWEEVPLSHFGKIICGKTPPTRNKDYFGNHTPFIKIPDMHGQTFIFQTAESLSEAGNDFQFHKKLPPKSICVSCIATVGLVAMNVYESQTNQQINSIIPHEDKYRYFLYFFICSITPLLHAMASGGTATMNLNTHDFSKISLPLVTEQHLIEFDAFVSSIFAMIFVNQSQRYTLEKFRDILSSGLLARNKLKID